MANLTFYPVQARNRELKVLVGKLALTSAAAVTSITGRGMLSAVKSATGRYTITLEDRFFSVSAISLTVETVGAWVLECAVRTDTVNSTAPTIVISTLNTAGAETDTGVAGTIHIVAYLRNSDEA